MRKRISQAAKNPLIAGSAIIFLGSNIGNFFNFLFNIFMVRNLSAVDYGTFASLMSLIVLLTIPAGAVSPVITKFAAAYFAKSDLAMVRGLFFKITRPSLILGIPVFFVFLFFSQDIAYFLKIEDISLLPTVGAIIFLSFIGIANTPLLQAKLEFPFISFISFLGAILKLTFGVAFVYLGFSVKGAIAAVVIAYFIPYLLSFLQLRFVFVKNYHIPAKITIRELMQYGIPTAVALFSLTSLTSTDILIVKHFFSPEQAGIYAGISLLAKIIFFLSAPIGTVMFPLIVQKYTRKENYHNDFKIALALVFIPSLCITGLYFIFPELIIKISSKQEYISSAFLLGVFGIFITLYSVLTIITNFFLSINKTKIFIPIAAAASLQVILIWFFHKTFLQVVLISLSISCLLLVVLLLYYWLLYGTKEKR